MTLYRLTPDFEKYFDNYFRTSRNYQSENDQNCSCNPKTNITEHEDKYLLEMAVPGIDKSKVQINVEDEILTVKYESESAEKEGSNKQDHYIRREFAISSFERNFNLSDVTDSEKISASYQNGILKIEIPLKEKVKNKVSKNIEIA
jgi:HSP20 family protein